MKSTEMKYLTATLFVFVFAQGICHAQTDSLSNYSDIEEITVTARRKEVKLIDNGFSYNMAANSRAQKENTLQALQYVPLINIDFDGKITVQGSSSYSLYLNGKPYDMAQTSPKAFLESLPGSSIARVELITNPTAKYGPGTGRYVINIILKHPLVDGYTVNLAGGGGTQPTAHGSLLAMARKNRVDVSLTYDYDLNGQRNQLFSYVNEFDDNTSRIVSSKGNGDWHTHTLRGMAKWAPDSLNTVYADMHGLINANNFTTRSIITGTNIAASYLNSKRRVTSGALECNAIYRNYYPRGQTEKFMAGYHFTYNPDKHNNHQVSGYPDSDPAISKHISDGGLYEHTASISYLAALRGRHFIRFSLADVIRKGDTHSTLDGVRTDAMSYTDNIFSPGIAYTGYVGHNLTIQASAAMALDHLSMKLPMSPHDNFCRNKLYITPSAMVYWIVGQNNALILNYGASVRRPAISMLNPYRDIVNDYLYSTGNPALKNQYNHELDLTWAWNAFAGLNLYAAIAFSHADDIILNYNRETDGAIIESTYGNLGTSNQLEMSINLSCRPLKWLMLSSSFRTGRRWLKAEEIKLDQNDFLLNYTQTVSFLLPHSFRITAQYGLYRNLPDPRSVRNNFYNYFISASKSFLNGRFNISVQASSPFRKYHVMRIRTILPGVTTFQTNHITSRSLAISMSYSFGSGRRVALERDRTLKSSDQPTGVR